MITAENNHTNQSSHVRIDLTADKDEVPFINITLTPTDSQDEETGPDIADLVITSHTAAREFRDDVNRVVDEFLAMPE